MCHRESGWHRYRHRHRHRRRRPSLLPPRLRRAPATTSQAAPQQTRMSRTPGPLCLRSCWTVRVRRRQRQRLPTAHVAVAQRAKPLKKRKTRSNLPKKQKRFPVNYKSTRSRLRSCAGAVLLHGKLSMQSREVNPRQCCQNLTAASSRRLLSPRPQKQNTASHFERSRRRKPRPAKKKSTAER